MPTYHATWPDVPQLDVTGTDLIDVLTRASRDFESLAGDPEDDPDYVGPALRWELGWTASQRALYLYADGKRTEVRVDVLPDGPHAPAPDCAQAGHPMAVYRRDRNDSVCLCGQAWERGDFRTASVTA